MIGEEDSGRVLTRSNNVQPVLRSSALDLQKHFLTTYSHVPTCVHLWGGVSLYFTELGTSQDTIVAEFYSRIILEIQLGVFHQFWCNDRS